MNDGERPNGETVDGDHRHVVRSGYDAIAGEYTAQRTADGDRNGDGDGDGDGDEDGDRDQDDDGESSFLADLCDRLEAKRNPRVLDAGCGGGVPVTATLAESAAVVGLDISSAQLDLARENVPAASLAQGDLASLPLERGTVDAVTSFHAVIHVPREEHRAVFREFHRVLRPDGALLVTLGTQSWEGRNEDWLETGTEMRWSFHGPERNRALLAEAGFAIERERTVADDLGDGAFQYVLATPRE